MSKIGGKETNPEILVRKYLFAKGFRYRKNEKKLPGKPDIVLNKYKAVIFVHGCFWHNHKGCKKSKLPNTRKEFWKNKIEVTVRRDQRNISDLTKQGWRIAIVWECGTKNKDYFKYIMNKLAEWIVDERSKRIELTGQDIV